MFAGSIASLTVLGAPDIIVLTLTEFADQARRICRAGELSLIVDADHGYGNALNVKRCVEELENAGVACLTIEDTLLPQRFGNHGTEFLQVAEGVGKMKAALAGRQDPDLIILGRTGAVGPNGVEDGIRRARAYLDAGVDGIMFVGVKTRAELEAIASELDAPIMLGGSGAELQDLELPGECWCQGVCRGISLSWPLCRQCMTRSKPCARARRQRNCRALASTDLIKQLTRRSPVTRPGRMIFS